MEKYGVVVEEPEQPKEAEDKPQEGQKCPDCEQPLEKDANVPKCPVHGTGPFEK